MSQIIDHVGNRYLCPVTQKTETVLIQHTTMRQEQTGANKGAFYPSKKNLKYCSGLDTCGVMKDLDDKLSCRWERCPLKASL